jgi:hypothetical protein
MKDYVYPNCFWMYGMWEARHWLKYNPGLVSDDDMLMDYAYLRRAAKSIPSTYAKEMKNGGAPSAGT